MPQEFNQVTPQAQEPIQTQPLPQEQSQESKSQQTQESAQEHPQDPSQPHKKEPNLFERAKKLDDLYKEKRIELDKDRKQIEKDKEELAVLRDLKGLLEKDPLLFMEKAGLTYDQITKLVLERSSPGDPALKKIMEKIDRIEKEAEKKKADEDNLKYQKAYDDLSDQITKTCEENSFDLITGMDYINDVVKHMEIMYEKHGTLLTVKEACENINFLLASKMRPLKSSKWLQEQEEPPAIPKEEKTKTLSNKMTQSSETTKTPLTESDRIAAAIAQAKKLKVAA